VSAVSTLHDLPAYRHNDPWKFMVVGINENGPLYRTDLDFFGNQSDFHLIPDPLSDLRLRPGTSVLNCTLKSEPPS